MKEYRININGTIYNVSIEEVGNGNETTTRVAEPVKQTAPTTQASTVSAPSAPKTTTAAASQSGGGEGKPIKSPLPGVILDVFVNVGDSVKVGQKVILLEAMKMENNIEANFDGTVKEIKTTKGDSVYEGDILLIIG